MKQVVEYKLTVSFVYGQHVHKCILNIEKKWWIKIFTDKIGLARTKLQRPRGLLFITSLQQGKT